MFDSRLTFEVAQATTDTNIVYCDGQPYTVAAELASPEFGGDIEYNHEISCAVLDVDSAITEWNGV